MRTSSRWPELMQDLNILGPFQEAWFSRLRADTVKNCGSDIPGLDLVIQLNRNNVECIRSRF